MEIWQFIILIVVGILVGFINVISGGGSLITLPILIFFGLDSTVANASNRIGNVAQNVFALAGFKSKGIIYTSYTYFLGISSAIGAVFGTFMALKIEDRYFNKILAVVMLMVVIFTIFNPKSDTKNWIERVETKHKIIGIIFFFFIGIYGGFIQAGTGLLIMAALSLINKFSFVKINSYKVVVVLFYLSIALIIFIYNGKVNWLYGITLGVGTSIGGWFSSRWSFNKGDKWIKKFMIVSVSALSIKLFFY